jgi:hypothetical protein
VLGAALVVGGGAAVVERAAGWLTTAFGWCVAAWDVLFVECVAPALDWTTATADRWCACEAGAECCTAGVTEGVVDGAFALLDMRK